MSLGVNDADRYFDDETSICDKITITQKYYELFKIDEKDFFSQIELSEREQKKLKKKNGIKKRLIIRKNF